jgi:hypothetical protein
MAPPPLRSPQPLHGGKRTRHQGSITALAAKTGSREASRKDLGKKPNRPWSIRLFLYTVFGLLRGARDAINFPGPPGERSRTYGAIRWIANKRWIGLLISLLRTHPEEPKVPDRLAVATPQAWCRPALHRALSSRRNSLRKSCKSP